MDLPSRKPTRLKGFDYSTAGVYFVTICTENKSKILCDIVGGGDLDAPQVQLTEIGKIAEKYILSTNNIKGMTVEKYVIMPNHIHLLLRVTKDGTSRAPSPTNNKISRAIAVFKRFVNKEVGRNIFQRSFNDHIIRDEQDYQTRWKYIHENPQKWTLDRYYTE